MAKHDISLYGKCTSTICAGKSHFDIRDEIFLYFCKKNKKMNTCAQIEKLNLRFIDQSKQNRQPETIILSEGQKKIINFLDSKPLSVIKHSRRVGASTALVLYVLANALCADNKNKRFCFISDGLDSRKHAYGQIKEIMENSLSEEEMKQISSIRYSITFPNNNIIYFMTSEGFQTRMASFDVIIGDNAAFFAFDIERYKQLLNKDGRICFVSTPHVIDNDFAKLWIDTKDNEHLSITFMDSSEKHRKLRKSSNVFHSFPASTCHYFLGGTTCHGHP